MDGMSECSEIAASNKIKETQKRNQEDSNSGLSTTDENVDTGIDNKDDSCDIEGHFDITKHGNSEADQMRTNKTVAVTDHNNEDLAMDIEMQSGARSKCSYNSVDNNNNGISLMEGNYKPMSDRISCERNGTGPHSFIADKSTNTNSENYGKSDQAPLSMDTKYSADKNNLLENTEKSDDVQKTDLGMTDNSKAHVADIDKETFDETLRGSVERQTVLDALGNQEGTVDNSSISEVVPRSTLATEKKKLSVGKHLSTNTISINAIHENVWNKRNIPENNSSANASGGNSNEQNDDNENRSGLDKQSLHLDLPYESPENDVRGVSPEIVCLTHLSPTTIYGKDHLAIPSLLSDHEKFSRPPSLNTPDPLVFGESDSSSCPTPFLYTSSDSMPSYSDNLYSTNNSHFKDCNYSYVLSEDPQAESANFERGHKRKLNETDANNNELVNSGSNTARVTPDMLQFANKGSTLISQMYQYQGRPPDVSTWTAVNSGACKYGSGFGTSCGQNFGNSFARDPFLFSYQQQFSECGYNSQINSQFSSKPTCAVPPYMLNHTQTSDSYSAYSHNTNNENQHFGSQFNIPVGGSTLNNMIIDPSERTRASCQFESNQSVDVNNNNQASTANTCLSNACYRLDFSSPVSEEQCPYNFPVPTFVSTHSYISTLSRPEPVLPNNGSISMTNRSSATCNSTYSRPSSAMSTHSENGAEALSVDLTQASSDEETVTEGEKDESLESSKDNIETQADERDDLREMYRNEVHPETAKVSWSSDNMVIPVRARSTQLICPLSDLKNKTVKELLHTAENKSESDGEHNASSSTQSGTSPPPAHQQVTESFAAEFIKQRKTKSPISAFCAALDLSKPKKKDRHILPHPSLSIQPAIPIPSLLNVQGPTLTYSGSMMVPYLQTLYAANSYLNTSKTGTGNCNSQRYVPIVPNRMPYINPVNASQTNISPALNSETLLNCNPFATMSAQSLQYLPYVAAATTVPLNQLSTTENDVPNINLSNIPLPLYQQLPQNINEQQSQTLQQTPAAEESRKEEEGQQFLCRRNIGLAVPVGADSGTSAVRRQTRRKKKKSAAFSTAPPPVTVPAFTASIQGSSITTGLKPSKDAITYYPTPARPEIISENCGKRAFKARHCNFAILRIGTFQYICPTISYEKIARVKFLYSKKKLLYEFQLNDLEAASVTPHRRLTEIEVPFNTVIGLWLFEREMRLEVNAPPTMCLGSKILEKHPKHGVHAPPIYDRHQLVDLTNGQLRTIPYHYIQFKSCCAEKLKTEMGQFDSRFGLLLRSPLIEDPNKTLRIPEVPITSHLLEPVLPTGKPKRGRHKSYAGCRCETGCSSDLCSCCVRGGTCTEGECLCINCRNPLNILHQLGLPVHRARTDPCLMENIYQIKKLECYVKIQLLLECCQIPLMLLQCIPGTFTCPSIGCGIKYTYSWCCAQLCNEDVAPRNHCVKCGRCTDYRNKHCELCNICYFAGESGSFKCPVCHNGADEDAFVLDSSSDSDV